MQTKVKDLMTENPDLISPDATIQEAAEKMEKLNCGILPVGTRDKLEGIITDRDIVIRAITHGENPKKQMVNYYMTKEVFTCAENDNLEKAADQMRKHKVSRLIVTDDEGQVSGILSFGCILRKEASTKEISNVIEHAIGKRKNAS